jgi:oxygen-independent coproporphyrinogen-3 oxidase
MRWQERGLVTETDEARYEVEFLETHQRLAAAGYEHYEVSNYARPGCRARHNSAYWKRVPYVGLGPAAHSHLAGTRRWSEREYVAWRQRIGRGEDPIAGQERLTPDQVQLEDAYLGLRSDSGVLVSAADRPLLNRWAAQGWVTIATDRAFVTPLGWLRLDAMTAALTSLRSH